MDLKGITNLDPKLKATYERVMGTSFTPAQPPSAAQTPSGDSVGSSPLASAKPSASVPNIEAPAQPPPVRPIQQVTEVEQHQSVSQPEAAQSAHDPLPSSEPIIAGPAPAHASNSATEMVQSPQIFSTVNPFQETVAPPGEVLAKNAVVPGKKMNQPVIIGLVAGGIVFFIVYAFIWAKVFGLF